MKILIALLVLLALAVPFAAQAQVPQLTECVQGAQIAPLIVKTTVLKVDAITGLLVLKGTRGLAVAQIRDADQAGRWKASVGDVIVCIEAVSAFGTNVIQTTYSPTGIDGAN